MKQSMEREFKITETKEGVNTLAVNNVLLHSKYYPSKEAEQFIKSNQHIYENKKVVLVYGLAFGYHIKQLLNKVSDDTLIYVFDIDKEIVNIAKQQQCVKEILEDNRVKLISKDKEMFFKELKEKMNLVQDIIYYKPSIKVLPKEYENFKEAIMDYEISKLALEDQGGKALENSILNEKIKSKTMADFFKEHNFKGMPIFLISSGPSLDKSIPALKKIREKENIKFFAAGSALQPLMKAGIKPDMICILDADDMIHEQIEAYENLDIPLCFAHIASHKAVSNYKGDKYIYYNEESEERKNEIIIETGKSVATAVLSIAIKGGGNPIIFVAQDLAFLDNKTHCNNYPHEMQKIYSEGIYRKVEGVDGTLLNTNEGLLYFKRWIERTIEKNPGVRFVNCSGGARIKGTEEREIQLTVDNGQFS